MQPSLAVPASPLLTCTEPFFLQQSQALLCGKTPTESGPVRPQSQAQPTWEDTSGTLCPCPRPQVPSLMRVGWVLQGHLLGTEVGGLVTKAECGGPVGAISWKGRHRGHFAACQDQHCPQPTPGLPRPSCRRLFGGKHSPLGSRTLLCDPLLVWGERPARHR